MQKFKIVICGILLSFTAWMPCFANGFDEVIQSTQDPYVAYTLHGDMSIDEAIQACDTMTGWDKKIIHVNYLNYDGPPPITYTYTRMLDDNTKQVLTFFKMQKQTKLSIFTLIFYAKDEQEAMEMYEKAYHNIDSYQKWKKTGGLTTNYAVFTNSDGYTIQLIFNKDNKQFAITRYLKVIH